MKFKYHILLLFIASSVRANAQTDTAYHYNKPLFDFEYIKPAFKLAGEQLSNTNRMLRFTVLTGYREGVKPVPGLANFTSYVDKAHGTIRIYMYNLSIAEMVNHFPIWPVNVVLEVKHPEQYIYDARHGDKEAWYRKNAHCFELLLPMGTSNSQVLDQQLSAVLGISFNMEKRMADALVLVRISTIDKLKTKGVGAGRYNIAGEFNNIPISRLGHHMREAGLPPLVDETGYKDKVDMNLGIKDWSDLAALRQSLKRYDLDLKLEKREIEMLVIKEIK